MGGFRICVVIVSPCCRFGPNVAGLTKPVPNNSHPIIKNMPLRTCCVDFDMGVPPRHPCPAIEIADFKTRTGGEVVAHVAYVGPKNDGLGWQSTRLLFVPNREGDAVVWYRWHTNYRSLRNNRWIRSRPPTDFAGGLYGFEA